MDLLCRPIKRRRFEASDSPGFHAFSVVSLSNWSQGKRQGNQEQRTDPRGLADIWPVSPHQRSLPQLHGGLPGAPGIKNGSRWVDRLVPDGSWSGNLFDFYQKVIRKLTADLKIPFVLEGDQRQDDTPVHKALREALVNTLIHSDYTGRISVLVVKRPDMFGFRNPGDMRVSIEDAIAGSTSDCRNRS